MSRVIVKGLPKYLTEKRLKQHFEKAGEVTDCKILFKDGVNRRMAFIGFKTESAAENAKKTFHRSYLDTSKLTVDFAKVQDDPTLPRAWSKYSQGSSAFNKKHGFDPRDKRQKGTNKDDVSENKREFQNIKEVKKSEKYKEFLDLMRPTKAKHSWKNTDHLDDPLAKDTNEGKTQPAEETPADTEKTGKEKVVQREAKTVGKATVIQEVVHKKTRQHGDVHTRTKIKFNFSDDDVKNGIASDSDSDLDTETIKKTTEAVKEMKSKAASVVEERREEAAKEAKLAEEAKKERKFDPKRLYLRNIPFDIQEDDLRKKFDHFGPIEEILIPRFHDGCRGYAFVKFEETEHAILAYANMDKQIFMGRKLHITPSEIRENEGEENLAAVDAMQGSNPAGSSYKQSHDDRLKENAGNEESWNSLFLNQNAVINSIASKLDVDKGKIMDLNADDLAVRLSLSETQILNETKKWMRENGLSVDSFTGNRKSAERSNRILLIKNIPFESKLDELRQIFSRFGVLGRTLIAPSKTLAIMEYLEERCAQTAFSKLSYYKYKRSPLYLEWAPVNTFMDQVEENKDDVEMEGGKDTNEEEPSKSLFVKNLNFDTTEVSLRKAFTDARIGKVTGVKIVSKKDSGLSSGYGFVEMEDEEGAKKALRKMQNAIVDDHAIQVSLSKPKKKEETKASRKRKETEASMEPTTKLLVRNLPFEATKKDLRTLFSNYAQVKSVRIPKKFDNTHRGFGFVEFISKQEAKIAAESLGNTHLFGRKLVLEWAKAEETLTDLREKAAKKMKIDEMEDVPGRQHKKTALVKPGKRREARGDDDIPMFQDSATFSDQVAQ